ncbi:hypothetical protein PQX77_019306 [Marasmius sp. AFHP31]|nr:hypothetical protein PQX77_019306 [Marasmius sp. AFHP31]
MDSDIYCLRVQSSEILSVDVEPDDEASTSSKPQAVRLKKMVQTAEIAGRQERFTATTLEPVDVEDQDLFKKIAKGYLQAAVCHRSALLTQVFAVTESDAMTMLTYNDLTNANEIDSWYWNKDHIVLPYLQYIFACAVQSLRDDKALTFPVTGRAGDWSIDLKTLTWHYNPANISLNPPSEEDLEPFSNHFPPLCQDAVPQLNPTEIITHAEKNLGDFLYLIAAGGGRWIDDLSKYAQNGLLTFGAIVQCGRPGTLAHFPSTPSPELFCQSRSPDVEASYSNLGRVDLSFQKTGNVKVSLRFGLCISNNDLCVAYLCQSLPFYDGCRDVEDVGRDKIAEGDWKRLGIPKLSVQGLIGSYWDDHEYAGVRELLRLKNRALDGKQYAHERGYPELIPGDPMILPDSRNSNLLSQTRNPKLLPCHDSSHFPQVAPKSPLSAKLSSRLTHFPK